ncbi:DNA-binding MarR family transcriptional regulator [Allonocardiopsis opalescens]|uniref:DNA-binding MarR family transcriptional regulator n=1 Tax=Allonocardiopsis opalescens TaxID=1144618 RepID=A0A2T0PVB2_9ACTN|nr:DNA-binding MarR family transcriptional regulator [Allonocardiopsis opalescens]
MARGRSERTRAVAAAGRELSDAAVMFHAVVAARLGLGASEEKTLGLLQQHGPLTAGELGLRSGLAPASVTGVIDRLERRGFVSRERDPRDRRRVVVRIDDAAIADMERHLTGLARRLGTLYDRYTDAELELITGFLREAAARQRDATAELSDGA